MARITITEPGPGGDGGVVTPIDPPPPDVNDQFELEYLRASATNPKPLEEIEVTWSIKARDSASFADYIFDLVATRGPIGTGVNASGLERYSPDRNTLLRIVGRRRGSGDRSTLGNGIPITIDESDCRIWEIEGRQLDDRMASGLSRFSSASAVIRLRNQSAVVPTWEVGIIKYYYPLEVVLPHFFDADLDVNLGVRFDVEQINDRAVIVTTITHSSDVDYDNIYDIATGGRTTAIAKTADMLIPLILSLAAPAIEREIGQAIADGIPFKETHRLIAVRVVPDDAGRPFLSCLLCPKPEEPDPGPVVDPTLRR